jgi:hypothetical protein
MGRQMSKLLKRKKDSKKTDLLTVRSLICVCDDGVCARARDGTVVPC